MKTITAAPVKTATAEARALLGQVKEIALDLIDVNPLNPRKTFDDAGIYELAASIKSVGITNPLLLRPAPYNERHSTPHFEVVAGHRRRAAALLLERETVPCLVRELSDAEAADLALIDNLQRADVPALEEAEAFGELLTRHGSIEAVAARVGKDVAHVAKRLKLRALGLLQRDALSQQLIAVDHALLLARLGQAEQDEALKWCLDPHAGAKKPLDLQIKESAKMLRDDGRHRSWEPESVIRLKEHIEQSSGRKLSRAPWSLDDAELLPAAGACNVCPQNTKANTSLFEDLDIEAATCADGRCFELKRETFVQIKQAHAGMPPGSAIRLSWKQTSTEPRWEAPDPALAPAAQKAVKKPKLTQIFKAGQWIEAKKGSCADVITGVTIDWSDDAHHGYGSNSSHLRKPGQSLLVCIAPKCKVHRKEWEKPKSENNHAPQPRDPAAEKKAREDEEAIGKAEIVIRRKIMAAIVGKIDAAKAIHIVADQDARAPQVRKHLLDNNPKLSGSDLEALTVFCVEFWRAVQVNSYWMMQQGGVQNDRKELWALAKSVGLDADALAAKHFQDEYADQSSFESLAPWGSRLYPKNVKWPKAGAPAKKEPKPAVKSKTPKKAAAKSAKKGGK